LLIYLWINDELHVNRFHKYNSRLYQVMFNEKIGDQLATREGTAGLMSEVLKRDLPEVEFAATTTPPNWFQQFNISYKHNTVGVAGNFVSKDFFNVFSYQLLQGNKDQVLAAKNAIVISKHLARQLFNTTDNVVGKILEWKWLSFTKQSIITGVFDDMPSNSTQRFDFLLSFDVWKDLVPATSSMSGSMGPFLTYMVLKEGTDVKKLNSKLPGLIKTNFSDSVSVMFLRQYADGYLYGKYENGVQVGGRIEYVKLFSIIALFILVIACINFMNLSTAKAAGRIKEVGVKKALGAGRYTLVLQFLGESLFMSLLSLILALLIVGLLLPSFSDITGKHLSAGINVELIAAMLGTTALAGLLAGSYPALYLSRFRPALILKGKINNAGGGLWARKGLVVFQFAVSVIFIIGVMVVHSQLKYVQTKQLGYDKDNVIYFEMEGRVVERSDAFLAALKSISGVVNTSSIQSSIIISATTPISSVQWEGKNQDNSIRFYHMPVNYDLIETLGIQMAAGRSFSRQFSTDTTGVILNEAAVKIMGLVDPVGKIITMGAQERRILGVARNFHFNSLHEEIRPFIFRLVPQETMMVMARIQKGREAATLQRIKAFYNSFNPGYVFDYKFMDNAYQAQYTAEKLVDSLSGYFAGLAVIISCLGLFGLAAFTAERRQKEIGIRKVLGATVGNVVIMLSADFLKLVFVAMLLAFPLAWWGAQTWLAGFAYRIPLGADIFLLAGTATMIMTMLTISFQAVKAALANPVKSLGTE
ncbi:MAG TPA: ABC transporter permease, partial [Chitinophaga sp.]